MLYFLATAYDLSAPSYREGVSTNIRTAVASLPLTFAGNKPSAPIRAVESKYAEKNANIYTADQQTSKQNHRIFSISLLTCEPLKEQLLVEQCTRSFAVTSSSHLHRSPPSLRSITLFKEVRSHNDCLKDNCKDIFQLHK